MFGRKKQKASVNGFEPSKDYVKLATRTRMRKFNVADGGGKVIVLTYAEFRVFLS